MLTDQRISLLRFQRYPVRIEAARNGPCIFVDHASKYHTTMRNRALSLSLALAIVSNGSAQGLPELGDSSSAILSPQMERRIGEEAYRDIRLREPDFVDDPEITNYVNELGARLASSADGVRQSFEFFVIQNPTINAFAMPGGFIGVHTGLILAAQSESELASVLAHEISHVTQRHIARMFGRQSELSIVTLAAFLVAMLAARSSPDAAGAAMAGATAGSIQAQLNYSRDFEREADRVGFQVLERAGFDVNGMGAFFDRLLKAGRLYENNAPAYLRTHPMSTERMADMQNRAQNLPYRQVQDSPEFLLVRAKLRAETGTPNEALAAADAQVKERRYSNEAAARYSLVSALIRTRDYSRALIEMARLRSIISHPLVELLDVRLRIARKELPLAKETLESALRIFPNFRPLQYARVELLQLRGEHSLAASELAELVKNNPRDARLYALQAKSYSALGNRVAMHQVLAEQYVLLGSIPAAIEQLQLAQKTGQGDFYLQSTLDARLRELRLQMVERAKIR